MSKLENVCIALSIPIIVFGMTIFVLLSIFAKTILFSADMIRWGLEELE